MNRRTGRADHPGGAATALPPTINRVGGRGARAQRRPLAPELGSYLLDWEEARAADKPHAAALAFARSAFRHFCALCGWDAALPASRGTNPFP